MTILLLILTVIHGNDVWYRVYWYSEMLILISSCFHYSHQGAELFSSQDADT